MKTFHFHKANGLLESGDPVPDVELIFDLPLPPDCSVSLARTAFALDAHELAGVLRQILPGGTVDALLRELLLARASDLVVPAHTRPAPAETLPSTQRARPLDEWKEEDGAVLWWRFPLAEPPYVGDPRDDDWPGYHTHWTPIVVPDAPEATA